MRPPLPTEALGWQPTTERPRTLGDIPRVVAADMPERVAIVDGDRRVTYAELHARAGALAGALRAAGVASGDRVAVLLPNRAEFFFASFAIARAGAVAVPIGTRLSEPEVTFLCEHGDCALLVHDDRFAATAQAVPGVRRLDVDAAAGPPLPDGPGPDPASDAAIFYTSGTTASPKGVRLTHRGIIHCATMTGRAFRVGADDVELQVLPLYHTATHFLALPTLMAGGTVVVHEGFRAETTFALLEQHGVTLYPTVSAAAILMAKHAAAAERPYRLERLRMVFFGGAGVPESLLSAWEGFAPHTAVANVYGLTEMGPAVAAFDPAVHPPKPGSVGPPYPGVAVRIELAGGGEAAPGEIGEILVQGDSMMAGYWRNEADSAEALRGGWLHTGDLGYLDADGFLWISGRKKHMLKRGGENVFPNEVEAALIRHPGVKEALVVGVPDDVMGERVGAIVAPQPGTRLDPAALLEHCSALLADFKVPEYVAVLEPELPKNSVGKVDARQLQAEVRAARLELEDFRRGRARLAPVDR